MDHDIDWTRLLIWIPIIYLLGISRFFLWWAFRGQSKVEYWMLGFLFDRTRTLRWRIGLFLAELVAVLILSVLFVLVVDWVR